MSSGSYDPHAIETRIYEFWEQGGYFHAEPDPSRQPYTIVIPPPNVTGALHLGHALNSTIQDTLIRYHRMRGFNAEWMPGTDHAGIATQAVVEKKLRTDQNLTRHQLGREGLVAKIWEWKEEYGARILNQLRKMGVSCDWPRTRFTLDDICAKAVYEMFFRMFKDGLIYRGLRLVNWDAALQTAVADDEIVHQTVKGNLWHIRYPIENEERRTQNAEGERPLDDDAVEGRDYLVVATTRPETMLADTAVAVHPDDPRYQHLIGKRVILPLMNRPIPVVADPILVNKEFGTGCVKVTPGHDPNDYACWQRHQGEPDEFGILDLLTPDGKINEVGRSQGVKESRSQAKGEEAAASPALDSSTPRLLGSFSYAGLKKEDARKQVVADLEALGLLERVEDYETQVGHSDRSKTPIEPLRSEQWFVKMDKLAELALEAVRDGRVQFFPERFSQMYMDWLGEKRDWCISRQLWWGHRIPVWTREISIQELFDANRSPLQHFFEVFQFTAHVNVEEMDGSMIWRGIEGDPAGFTTKLNDAGRGLRNTIDRPRIVRVVICYAPRTFAAGADAFARLKEYLEPAGFTQDPDVLDTWFSSALWPFSTFGWPHTDDEKSKSPTLADLAYFFPGDVLVTARGIITLWVARMVMCSLYLTGRAPFRHVHIYPTILDGQGRIMSKSLGNGVDPLDLIEQFGTDATRFTLASLAGETQDIRIPVKPVKMPDGRSVNSSDRFEAGRNFANKLWQAATGFVLPNIAGSGEHGPLARSSADGPEAHAPLAIEDRWILSRLHGCIEEVDAKLAKYQLNDVCSTLYSFFWNDFCDWYVEWIKPRLATRTADGEFVRNDSPSSQTARRVLAFVLDRVLRLLHPVMPFITEELWSKLNEAAPNRTIADWGVWGWAQGAPGGPPPPHSPIRNPKSTPLIVARWPDAAELPAETAVERELAAMQDVIRSLRDIKAKVNQLRSAAKESAIRNLPQAVIKPSAALAAGLAENKPALERLGGCDLLTIAADAAKPAESFAKVLAGVEVYVPMAGLADLEVARKSLRKERDDVTGEITRREAKLSNESFVARAPAQVVEQERAKLQEFKERLAGIEQNLAELSGA